MLYIFPFIDDRNAHMHEHSYLLHSKHHTVTAIHDTVNKTNNDSLLYFNLPYLSGS